jgi:predicted alpha/beta-fold hydrolase
MPDTHQPDLGLPAFRPRFPWWGPDLQTLRCVLVKSRAKLSRYDQERILISLDDGSGDTLVAALNRPRWPVTRPLIVLIHGLTGLEDSFYMRESAGHFLALGYPVLRLNLRGVGRSRPLCATQYHAGSSADLARVFTGLPDELTRRGLLAVGYSLGANLLLKNLGESGGQTPLLAAAVVSAPLDLAVTARRLNHWRNAFYQRYLLHYMKAEAVAPEAKLTESQRKTVLRTRSVWQFDNDYSAKRAGLKNAEEYYSRFSSGKFLSGISSPVLLLHARDDPWIPPNTFDEFDWSRHKNLRPVLTDAGGHVGFHGHDRAAWHDLAIARFFAGFSPA